MFNSIMPLQHVLAQGYDPKISPLDIWAPILVLTRASLGAPQEHSSHRLYLSVE